MANAVIVHEARREQDSGWTLCLQWCRYVYDGGRPEQAGYRFVWRKPGGNLQPGRMQARIPSIEDAMSLIAVAKSEGWGELEGEGAGEGSATGKNG